jgi:spermidine/putrescine-binding protein
MGLLVHRHIPQSPVTGYQSLFRVPRPGGVAVFVEQRDFLAAALISLGASVSDHSPGNLRAARILLLDWLKNTAADSSGIWTPPLRLGYEKLIRQFVDGHHAAAILYSGDATALMAERPGCFEWVAPEEGTFKFVTNLAIPANSPRSAQAHQFLDFLLSPASTRMLTSIAAPGIPVQSTSSFSVPSWVFGSSPSDPSKNLFDSTAIQSDISLENPPALRRFLAALPAPLQPKSTKAPDCLPPSSKP